MPIDVTCPHRGRTLRAADRQAGKRCKCPGCAQLLTVPVPVGQHQDEAPRAASPTPDAAAPDPVDDLSALARAAAEARSPSPPFARSAPPPPAPAAPVSDDAEYEDPPPAAPPAARVLTYADGGTSFRAQPMVGAERPPLPVIAPPAEDVAAREKSWRGNGYWLLLLTFIPLGVLSFSPHLGLKDRLEQTMRHHPELPWGNSSLEEMTPQRFDELFDQLPGHRLEGAFLSRTSVYPWLMALASAAMFVGIARVALPAPRVTTQRIALTGLFTGTLGVCVLIAIQFVGMFCCVGLFYLAALSPTAPFGPSLIGFVLGVGICEEVVKCLPILWLLYRGNLNGGLLNWRDAGMIGLASGAGFGVSEGMLYSIRYYNGVEPALVYAVRFCSVIALHATLSAACALILQRKQDHLIGEKMDPINWLLTLAAIILVPIFLHGLFDALAKQELMFGSLLVAVGSFAWLSWLIRHARTRAQIELAAVAAGPRLVRTARGTRYVAG
jgi:RsiW-degrading membrane proteinase PrsW (M82 family)